MNTFYCHAYTKSVDDGCIRRCGNSIELFGNCTEYFCPEHVNECPYGDVTASTIKNYKEFITTLGNFLNTTLPLKQYDNKLKNDYVTHLYTLINAFIDKHMYHEVIDKSIVDMMLDKINEFIFEPIIEESTRDVLFACKESIENKQMNDQRLLEDTADTDTDICSEYIPSDASDCEYDEDDIYYTRNVDYTEIECFS